MAKDNDKSPALLESILPEELHIIADDYLMKTGLTELSEKLKAFTLS